MNSCLVANRINGPIRGEETDDDDAPSLENLVKRVPCWLLKEATVIGKASQMLTAGGLMKWTCPR